MKTSAKLLSALALFTATHLLAQSVPEYVNYQGLLKAADGSPLATGTYAIEFNIYDQANGGTKVWGPFLFDGEVGDGHGSLVPVANGNFNVIIGPKDTKGETVSTAFSAPSRFVEIKVDDGAPILPRQQFLSTAYAFAVGNAGFDLSAEALKARGTNAIVLGAGATAATGAISYSSNSPSLLVLGAGTNESSRNITLSAAVLVTNATPESPALAVAGDTTFTGNLTCTGGATINGRLRAASLTDGTRTNLITDIIRDDPPMVISADGTSDTSNWVIVPVDLSVLGNDEDGCKVWIYMQHETDHTLRGFTMNIWFEQRGFNNAPEFPDTIVRMFVQRFGPSDGAYVVSEFLLDSTKSRLFSILSGPWVEVWGGNETNKHQLEFRFHPNISGKIMVFDN